MDVIIEDIAPYTQRLSPEVIDTAKWIGETCYRLKQAEIPFVLIPRSTIKEWIFKSYPDVAIPMIEKKIERDPKKRNKKDGTPYKPSMVYVDNAIVVAAMRKEHNLPAETGKKNRLGITKDAWQALALATYWNKEGVRAAWNKMQGSESTTGKPNYFI